MTAQSPAQLASSPPADAPSGLNPVLFAALSLGLGVGAGFGAYGFRILIALVHNLAFLGRFSVVYDTNLHTARSPWGLGVVLVPVLGAAVVVFLVRHFAPEAKGHGVPEVMDAIYYQRGVIRPIVAAVKSVASAISIGTGGSVGREGPIVQISASLASLSGRLARASRWQRATLVAAGGGAGIAATFNAPIGGTLFAVEILLQEVSVRTLVPVALATTSATFIGRWLFANTPAFVVPQVPLAGLGDPAVLPAAIALGIAMGYGSVLFIRLLYGLEDWLEKWVPGHDYLRHMGSMLAVGLLFWSLFEWRGHYYIQGVGYATIMDLLSGLHDPAWFLVLLAAFKLAVTCLTLSSGGSGGVFSPSLFVGAALGTAYGLGMQALFPHLAPDPRVFALAGMAAMVAGATGAVLTSVVMLFEMTLDYNVVLPLTLAAAVSYGLRRQFVAESIYTLKLVRRGHFMPSALQSNAQLVRHISDIELAPIALLPADASSATLHLDAESGPEYFAIVSGDTVVGVLSREWALGHPGLVAGAARLDAIADRDFVMVPSDLSLVDLMAAMQRAPTALVLVTGHPEGVDGSATRVPEVLGVARHTQVVRALAEGMRPFED